MGTGAQPHRMSRQKSCQTSHRCCIDSFLQAGGHTGPFPKSSQSRRCGCGRFDWRWKGARMRSSIGGSVGISPQKRCTRAPPFFGALSIVPFNMPQKLGMPPEVGSGDQTLRETPTRWVSSPPTHRRWGALPQGPLAAVALGVPAEEPPQHGVPQLLLCGRQWFVSEGEMRFRRCQIRQQEGREGPRCGGSFACLTCAKRP